MCNNKVNIVHLHADFNNVAVGCFMSAGLSDPNNPQSMWLLSGEPHQKCVSYPPEHNFYWGIPPEKPFELVLG